MEEKEIVEQTTDTEKVDTLATEELEGKVEESNTAEATESGIKEVEEENGVKTFTQEEVDKIVKDRLFRKENKIRDEYEEKYSAVENILNAGLGTNDIKEATKKLAEFYKEQGIVIPEQRLTRRQERILAEAEANDVIADGYEALVKEVNRLANKGSDNLSSKEKLVFTKLAEERTRQESLRDLKSIGVGEDILEDESFKEFSQKLNPKLSLKEKYEMYEEMKPKKKIETIGSMKGTPSKDNGIKDFYSREEALKFTREDFDKNPKLFEAVENSMAKW